MQGTKIIFIKVFIELKKKKRANTKSFSSVLNSLTLYRMSGCEKCGTKILQTKCETYNPLQKLLQSDVD